MLLILFEWLSRQGPVGDVEGSDTTPIKIVTTVEEKMKMPILLDIYLRDHEKNETKGNTGRIDCIISIAFVCTEFLTTIPECQFFASEDYR